MEKQERKRELKTDLIKFTSYFFDIRGDKFLENSHHTEIAEALRKVETGEIKNLLINMPPRYGKTELGVINWIAQCIARNPKSKFIHLSYSDELALDNSSKAKELIESDEYQALWTVTLKSDAKGKKKWYTTQGGGLYATAAGGAITGFGAGSTNSKEFSGAIIIDDPLKVDNALSDLERNKVNSRLNTTIKSRRNSRHTPIVIIMQRLHEDDMSGFVLEGGMGEEFTHLKLAAIKEDGEALWPFKHTVEELEREKGADPYTFSGQMMQEPSPEDGEFFQRDWFKRFRLGEEPDIATYGASDYAVSEGKGDYTEQGVGGFDKEEDLWLIDWWSGQTTSNIWIEEQQELVRRHSPLLWVAEGGLIRRSVEPYIKKEMRSGAYYRLEWLTSNRDKASNARSFQALAANGKVHIPRTPWGEKLIDQLLKFPTGKYDDMVDVCGLFGRILDQTYGRQEIETVLQADDKDAYGLDDDDGDGWR